MFESFTLERFLSYAAGYNLELYPVQYLMLGLGLIAILLVIFGTRNSNRFISGILAFFYGWIGIQFYMIFFREFMPVPFVFGLLFITQAIIFILEGSIRNRINFRFETDLNGLAGALLILYAILGYQALEYILGRGYPEILSFGMFPCPTVIFSLGILLWTDKKFPRYILIVPLIHALSGFIPAFIIGIIEDIGLIISGLLILFLLVVKDKRHEPMARKQKEGPSWPLSFIYYSNKPVYFP
jgi:hypothetical protein